jgi:predicted nucleic acid-binding protein
LILADTSAWVEFLRRTGSPVNVRMRQAVRAGELAVCDAVRMEVLAGARNHRHLVELERLLAVAVQLPTEPTDYDVAAELFRTCRRRGETVRRLTDCLIAAVALRERVAVLHADADFAALARHTALEVVDPGR